MTTHGINLRYHPESVESGWVVYLSYNSFARGETKTKTNCGPGLCHQPLVHILSEIKSAVGIVFTHRSPSFISQLLVRFITQPGGWQQIHTWLWSKYKQWKQGVEISRRIEKWSHYFQWHQPHLSAKPQGPAKGTQKKECANFDPRN